MLTLNEEGIVLEEFGDPLSPREHFMSQVVHVFKNEPQFRSQVNHILSINDAEDVEFVETLRQPKQ